MKRRKIVSLLMALSITASMCVPAWATMDVKTSTDGIAGEDKDITVGVSGVSASDEIVYGTTIVWEDPTFTYTVDGGATTRWDPETHTYASPAGAVNGSFDKDSINVKVYNHSNAKIDASCFVGASASATTTSYNVSGYDVTLGVSNPDGNTATLPAAEAGSDLESVNTTFTLGISGTGMNQYATDLIASATNVSKLGKVVVVIGKREEIAPVLKEGNRWFNAKTRSPSSITSITLLDSYTPTGNETETWDASADSNGGVMCYLTGTDLIIAGNGSGRIEANANSRALFGSATFRESERFSLVKEIKGLELLDTSNVESMSNMFVGLGQKCDSVSLDLRAFNTENVGTFGVMFAWASTLETLDLSSFDTSKSIRGGVLQKCMSLAHPIGALFKLKSVTLGPKFIFPTKENMPNGDWDKYDDWDFCLPTPTSERIPGADGKWYDTNTGIGYTPKELAYVVRTEPVTYVAVNPNA